MPHEMGYILPEPQWDLKIFVPDLQVERTLRVRGDMHVGGIMLKLVEELDISIDWSDHALWWPKRNCWITKTRQTLNHYGVQADSFLNFTPMHKQLRVQLPDLRYLDARVDFSVECFVAVKLLCKELGIRHSEELSFCRPLSQEHLRRNYQNLSATPRQRGFAHNASDTGTLGSMRAGHQQLQQVHPQDQGWMSATMNGKSAANHHQAGTIDTRSQSPDITSTLSRHASYRGFTATYSTSLLIEDLKNLEISNSPHSPSSDAKASLLYPKNLAEKARMNAGWLDSHLSLYQQNVRDFDTLQLRFKYTQFYDLNPKLDMARINQIYEQAKWSLLTEEIDCTEDEMTMFGALQYQIQQQTGAPIPDDIGNTSDDIDVALNELQAQLEGGSGFDRTSFNTHSQQTYASPYNNNNNNNNNNNSYNYNLTSTNHQLNSSAHHYPGSELDSMPVLNMLELSDSIRFMKVRKFTFKTFKRLFFVLQEARLLAFRNKDDRMRDEPAFAIDLRGCDVHSDVNMQHGKFGVKLATPSIEGLTEYLLRFDTELQYARWLTAFRFASRDKPITDPSYQEEVRTVLELSNLQQYSSAPLTASHLSSNNNNYATTNTTTTGAAATASLKIDDYVAPKHSRARSGRGDRSAATRILEAHTNVKYLSAIDCKLNYIKAWKSLPDYGTHLFVVRFGGSNREEILGIASDRLVRIDASNGDHLRVWPLSRMRTWRVNWDSRQVLVESQDGDMSFTCLSADCKIPHEFIGGYVFLSMRSKGNNQTLNEELFYKLTKGRDE